MTRDDHINAFASAFILRHRRDRYLVKPDALIRKLCGMADEFDPRYVINLGPKIVGEQLTRLITSLTRATEAFYMASTAGADDGMYPLNTALQHAEYHGSALVSIEPGEFAFHKPEPWPSAPDLYLFIHNPARKAAAEKSISRLSA